MDNNVSTDNNVKLAVKLAQVRQKLGSLSPDKTNKDQGYQYISADKILERIGDALSEVGISIIPSVTSVTLSTTERPNRNPRTDACLNMSMKISDGDSEYEAPWIGYGCDYTTPDKAVYKAITGGHKYFLMKLLNIGVGNEDGEHENGESSGSDGQRQPPPVRQQSQKPSPKDTRPEDKQPSPLASNSVAEPPTAPATRSEDPANAPAEHRVLGPTNPTERMAWANACVVPNIDKLPLKGKTLGEAATNTIMGTGVLEFLSGRKASQSLGQFDPGNDPALLEVQQAALYLLIMKEASKKKDA